MGNRCQHSFPRDTDPRSHSIRTRRRRPRRSERSNLPCQNRSREWWPWRPASRASTAQSYRVPCGSSPSKVPVAMRLHVVGQGSPRAGVWGMIHFCECAFCSRRRTAAQKGPRDLGFLSVGYLKCLVPMCPGVMLNRVTSRSALCTRGAGLLAHQQARPRGRSIMVVCRRKARPFVLSAKLGLQENGRPSLKGTALWPGPCSVG